MAMPRNIAYVGRLLLLGCLFLQQTVCVRTSRQRRLYTEEKSLNFSEDLSWEGFPHLVQVSGLSVDKFGNLHIFHRGDRVWDINSFAGDNRLNHLEDGPIKNDTVLVVDSVTGLVMYSWGANIFYMPHGLTIDDKGNSWITDVGLHQVFKFPYRESTPTIVLGSAFEPGYGNEKFCKPTDVAVLKSGHFFVSDGYCNSRIVMYTPHGTFLKNIGTRDGMIVPHSLTLFDEDTAVCVADRENGRIFCYSTGIEGTPGLRLTRIKNPYLTRVFAVDSRGDKLIAVNGPEILPRFGRRAAKYGTVVDPHTGVVGNLWGPENGFGEAHDLEVSPEGNYVYIAEIEPSAAKKVYRFHIRDY